MTRELAPFYSKFPTRQTCIDYLELIRWNNIPACPKCGSTKHSHIKEKSAYHCNFCNRTFTATTKTIFHKSKIDLQKWFYAIHIMLQYDTNITSRDLALKIEVAKDTAWAIQKKLKNALIKSPQLLLKLDDNLNNLIYGKQ